MSTNAILLPKSDFIFKLLFGDEFNNEILASLLKSILDLPDEEFQVKACVDPIFLKEYQDDKFASLEVKLTTKLGEIINIEILVHMIPEIKEKIHYYISKMITQQVGSGDGYDVIKRSVSIVISDFNIIDSDGLFHHRFMFHDPERDVTFSDIQELHILELSKVPMQSDGTPLWDWMSFLKSDKEDELEMLAERSEIVGRAVDALHRIANDDKALRIYEMRERQRMDELSRIRAKDAALALAIAEKEAGIAAAKAEKDAGIAVEKAKAEIGIAQARARAEAEKDAGIAAARAKVEAEMEAAIAAAKAEAEAEMEAWIFAAKAEAEAEKEAAVAAIVKNALANGGDIESIEEFTGLSREVIESYMDRSWNQAQ
ncbi:MAG: Rpn family recombination-promoting nuclease/putative transposase [Clostridiales bacterium]|jgi:predicted transposase/invertase (TIGR01784 family)|nr:Rpn family recombination-promoting nuclease/putative transposase [Clostridiales bacterium]